MKLLNQRGFSLASVIIATGMMGALSVGVLQMIKTMNSGSRSSIASGEVFELTTLTRMILDNPNYCKVSLAGEASAAPVTFFKRDIDFGDQEVTKGSTYTPTSEGLNIDLWYGNSDGTVKTQRKLNGADNPDVAPIPDKSHLGFVKIRSMKLVMNNVFTGNNGNYPPGIRTEPGQIVVLYEKEERKLR